MAPKFKGQSEDWLDDEDSSNRGGGPRKKGAPKAKSLDPTRANATVAEVFPNQCRVLLDGDERSVVCNYRRAAVFGHSGAEFREKSPVCVGDRVLIESVTGQDGVVAGVCARRNRLVRPAPDREDIIQVIVSNLDALVIVVATQNPDFSPGLVDRLIVAASAQGIPAVLCVNKIDLIAEGTPESPGARPWRYYSQVGVDVFEISAKKALGLDPTRARIEGKNVAFCGHSGVGKTSLLRGLVGTALGKVGEVSLATGKGRHTTTGAVIVGGAPGGYWIDTPGVREFGLLGIEAESLVEYFPDLKGAVLGCEQASDCLHIEEAGCRAKDAPRYASYRRMHDSLVAGEH